MEQNQILINDILLPSTILRLYAKYQLCLLTSFMFVCSQKLSPWANWPFLFLEMNKFPQKYPCPYIFLAKETVVSINNGRRKVDNALKMR